MRIFIIVPIYNEGEVFRQWLPSLLKEAASLGAEVVVVDDGSEEQFQVPSSKVLDSSIEFGICHLLRHEVNCGVGAAIATGMEYAKQHGGDLVATIDGDGQHDPRDLLSLIERLCPPNIDGHGRPPVFPSLPRNDTPSFDIVNGSRFLKKQWIPWSRRLVNFLANIVTFLLSGFWVTDSQSGMKAFSKKALEKMEIQTAGYEWCSDIFREANWHGFRLLEVPISVLYNKYTLNKGQNLAIGIDMVIRLALRSLWK